MLHVPSYPIFSWLVSRIYLPMAQMYYMMIDIKKHHIGLFATNLITDPFVLPNGAKLNSLLYPDDLIIFSRSKIGLQNCLDKLSSFCTSWMMKINPKKTKIMVFQKRARKNADFHFLIDSQIIDVVQEYTYLGTRMSSLGNSSVT